MANPDRRRRRLPRQTEAHDREVRDGRRRSPPVRRHVVGSKARGAGTPTRHRFIRIELAPNTSVSSRELDLLELMLGDSISIKPGGE